MSDQNQDPKRRKVSLQDAWARIHADDVAIDRKCDEKIQEIQERYAMRQNDYDIKFGNPRSYPRRLRGPFLAR